MKRKNLLRTLVLLICCAACARGPWFDALDAAREEAKKSGRPILAIFTSRGANALTEELEREALDSPAFRDKAGGRFVLANIELSAMQSNAQPNESARDLILRYGIHQSPTIVMLDSEGRSCAVCDYDGEDGLDWLAKLSALDTRVQERDELLRSAIRETDPEKRLAAFVLAINTFSDWGIIGSYPELKSEAIRLDGGNKAGLKAKYSAELAIGEISETYLATNALQAGLAAITKLLAEYPDGEAAQNIYYTMAMLELRLGRVDETRRLLYNAINAAPASAEAETIRAALRSFESAPD